MRLPMPGICSFFEVCLCGLPPPSHPSWGRVVSLAHTPTWLPLAQTLQALYSLVPPHLGPTASPEKEDRFTVISIPIVPMIKPGLPKEGFSVQHHSTWCQAGRGWQKSGLLTHNSVLHPFCYTVRNSVIH